MPTWGRVEDIFRHANDMVVANVGKLEPDYPIPLLCECRDPHCFAPISLTLKEYEQVRADPRRYLTIPGHEPRTAA